MILCHPLPPSSRSQCLSNGLLRWHVCPRLARRSSDLPDRQSYPQRIHRLGSACLAELSRFGDEDERYSRLGFSADISALHLGHLPEGLEPARPRIFRSRARLEEGVHDILC